jgi:hypothetical protein
MIHGRRRPLARKSLRKNENIEDEAVLIHCSPQSMPQAVQEDLIQMPFVSGTGTTSPQAGFKGMADFSHQRRRVS